MFLDNVFHFAPDRSKETADRLLVVKDGGGTSMATLAALRRTIFADEAFGTISYGNAP